MGVLASGENPDREVYQIEAKLKAGYYTAIRLEGLTDQSLPHKGAGRSENSNVVLSEFEAKFATSNQPNQWHKIEFSRAWADHEQPNGNFKVANAIDGNAETGWATDGADKRENRQAIFLAKEAFGGSTDIQLRVWVKHESPHTQHNFGRVRLATTVSDKYAQMKPRPTVENWYSVGPFPTENFAQVHEPEKWTVNLDQTYEIGNKTLVWKEEKKYDDGKIHSTQIPDKHSLFLYRLIHSSADQRITLSLGSDDAIKGWVNGTEVLANNV